MDDARGIPTVLYVRISQDRTGDAAGVERQERDCRLLAAAKSWTVQSVLTDNDVSATSGKRRPAFEDLVRQVQAGEAHRVVVWHLDRLVRRMSDLTRLIEAGSAGRLNIASVHGVSLDLGDPTGVAVAQILTAIAGMEVAHKANRQRSAAQQAADRGAPPSRRAFGYAQNGLEIIPEEAEAVRDAYAQLLAGASLISITNTLNDRGLRSTRGGKWQRTMTRAMLINARNAGLRSYRGEIVSTGQWPAIVAEETWRAAVDIVNDPRRKSNRTGTARRWLGGGYYLCGRCGSDVRSGYRENQTRVYICRTSKHLSRVADPIDQWVEMVIAQHLSRPDNLARITADSVDIEPLRADVTALRHRLDQVAGDYADGQIDARQLRLATERLNARLTAAEAKLVAAGRSSRLGPLLSAADPGEAWRNLDVSARQAVARAVVTVTLLPTGPGRAAFNTDTIRIEPV